MLSRINIKILYTAVIICFLIAMENVSMANTDNADDSSLSNLNSSENEIKPKKSPFVELMFSPFLSLGNGQVPDLYFDSNANQYKYKKGYNGSTYQVNLEPIFTLKDFNDDISLIGGPTFRWQYISDHSAAGAMMGLMSLGMHDDHNFSVVSGFFMGGEIGIRYAPSSSFSWPLTFYARISASSSLPNTNSFRAGCGENETLFSIPVRMDAVEVISPVNKNVNAGLNLSVLHPFENSSVSWGLNYYLNWGMMSWRSTSVQTMNNKHYDIEGSSMNYTNRGLDMVWSIAFN